MGTPSRKNSSNRKLSVKKKTTKEDQNLNSRRRSLRKRSLNPATYMEMSESEDESTTSTAANENIQTIFYKETCNLPIKIKEEKTSLPVITAVYEETNFNTECSDKSSTSTATSKNMETKFYKEACNSPVKIKEEVISLPEITDVHEDNFYTECSSSNNIPTSQISHSPQIASNYVDVTPSTNFTSSLQNSKKDTTHMQGTESDYQFSLFNEGNVLLKDVINHLNDCAYLDRFDIAGKLCAAKMRYISKVQLQYAEELIDDVLLEAEQKHLDPTTILSKTSLKKSRRKKTEYVSDAYFKNRNMCIPNLKHNSISSSERFCLDSKINLIMRDIRQGLINCAHQDVFDVIGTLYAKKMRSFQYIQYLYAENLINEILLKAELGQLDNTFVLSHSTVPSTKSSQATYSEKTKKTNTFTVEKEAPMDTSLIQSHSENDALSNNDLMKTFVRSAKLLLKQKSSRKCLASKTQLSQVTKKQVSISNSVKDTKMLKNLSSSELSVVKPKESVIKSSIEKKHSFPNLIKNTMMLKNSSSPELLVLKSNASIMKSTENTPVVPQSSIYILPFAYPTISCPSLISTSTIQFPVQPVTIIT